MKRYGDLWEKIITFENIYEEFNKTLKGKRKNYNANEFFINAEDKIIEICEQLKNNNYKFGKYSTFYVYDPKERMISAAPFKDRIVHHALINILEPVFEKKMIYHSYACRKGKGTYKTFKQFEQWFKNSDYILKLDIKKFFPSINHQMLKNVLKKIIKDTKVLDLCNIIIDSSNKQEIVLQYFKGDNLFSPIENKVGLPIGNLTSQFFANIYLTPLDYFIKEELKIKKYLRYMDDFVLFHNDKSYLKSCLVKIKKFLKEYKLNLHSNKTQIKPTKETVPFLGFLINRKYIKLGTKNLKRLRIRIKHQKYLLENNKITKKELECSLYSWRGFAHWSRSYKFAYKITEIYNNI